MSVNDAIVYVVSADEQSRRCLCEVIESAIDGRCECTSIRALLDAEPPDGMACVVVNVDGDLPDIARTIESLAQDYGLPVIATHADPSIRVAVDLVRHGALNYLAMPCEPQLVRASIREALDHDRHGYRLKLKKIQGRLTRLTPRERQVMELVDNGEANKSIAEKMGVSIKTVEVHRSRVMRKMEAGSLAQLVRDAVALESARGERDGSGI